MNALALLVATAVAAADAAPLTNVELKNATAEYVTARRDQINNDVFMTMQQI